MSPRNYSRQYGKRQYARGTVVKGPDLLGPHTYRPYVCLSTTSPPFRDEEAVYAAITTTRRSEAIPLTDDDFTTGSLPRESYVNPTDYCILLPVNARTVQRSPVIRYNNPYRGRSSRSNTPISTTSKDSLRNPPPIPSPVRRPHISARWSDRKSGTRLATGLNGVCGTAALGGSGGARQNGFGWVLTAGGDTGRA